MNGACMKLRNVEDCERLYSLDVMGVEDRGGNAQLHVLGEINWGEHCKEIQDGRYDAGFPWIPGATLTETNEVQSTKRYKA